MLFFSCQEVLMIGVLIGGPGSGKGEQGDRLKELGYRKVSSGDVLRDHRARDTEIGRRVATIMDEGELVPDHIVFETLRDKFEELAGRDIVLDGFPRTPEQARQLDVALPPDWIIFLDVPKAVVKQRIADRQTCPQCNRVFGTATPPQQKGICDGCGTQLEQRTDDQASTIFEERWRQFETLTIPVLDHYWTAGRLLALDGDQSPEEVARQIKALLTEVSG